MYKWEGHPYRELSLVVPSSLKKEVLFHCHDSGVAAHLGQEKTLHRLQRSFYWHNLTQDGKLYVSSCSTCNQNKKANQTAKSGLGQYHAGFPMERVHLDILGPFVESLRGNKYILVMVDQFSKWVELAAIPDQTAEVIATQFLSRFVSTFGCPLEVHTDQGKNFDSNLFKTLCELLQISKTRTTPYRPCSNGQVERYNRLILAFVWCFSQGRNNGWDEHLVQLSMALHSMVNRSTGFTPNLLMLGREVIQPIDLFLGTLGLEVSSSRSKSQWLQRLIENCNMAQQMARRNLQTSQVRQKRDYDMRLSESHYSEGDVVYKLESLHVRHFERFCVVIWK